jgi:hypothetical protein
MSDNVNQELEEDLVILEEKPEGHDEGDQDERTGHDVEVSSLNDDERDSIRERRRLEKLERKDRKEKAISRDKLEMDFLRKRNDDLERRVSAQEIRSRQVDLGSFDAHIQQAARDAELADKVIAKAVEAGNGDDVTQAIRYREIAISKIQQLNQAKINASMQPVAQAPAVDELMMHYANEFIKENKWYDPQGRDEDSSIVLAIDKSLAQDGFNPQTEEYWAELRKRAARRLPDHFPANGSRDDRQSRGGPVLGSGREHAPTSTRKEIYISPERKQALMDAGVWDDPVLRNKYVKRYAEYDRTHR